MVVGALSRRLRPDAQGLTHVSLSALATVARVGAIRPGDLARAEGVGAPGATRVLADLEQRGLVAREADPADGRSTLFRPTDAGQDAIVAARRHRAAAVELLLADAADEHLATIAEAVAVLERALVLAPRGR